MIPWTIALWVVALAFILITLKNMLVRAVKMRRCTKAVTGTVVEVREKRRTQSSGGRPRVTTTEYIPTVRYAVGGAEYSRPFAGSYRADAYSIGQAVEIMVNPDRPSEINRKGTSNRVDVVMLCVGVALGVAGAALLTIR